MPSALQEKVDEGGDWSILPIVGPDDYEQLKTAMAQCKPDMTPCPVEKLEEMMATTALMHPDAKLTDRDQVLRLRAYKKTLGDLPYDVLSQAFADCAKEIAFFPKVAEIRERANRILKKRRLLYNRMSILCLKHEKEYLPPPTDSGEPASPRERNEFNVLMRKMGVKTRAFADGTVRPLEDGEADPTPEPEAPPSAEEPGLPL